MLNYYYMSTGVGRSVPPIDKGITGEYQRPPNGGNGGNGYSMVLAILATLAVVWVW